MVLEQQAPPIITPTEAPKVPLEKIPNRGRTVARRVVIAAAVLAALIGGAASRATHLGPTLPVDPPASVPYR